MIGEVEALNVQLSESYLVLALPHYQSSIKRLKFLAAAASRSSYLSYINCDSDERNNEIMLTLREVGIIEYPHLASFSDYLRGATLHVDELSINRYLICTSLNTVHYLLSSDYQDRGASKISKFTMLFPEDIPYLHQLILLLFSSYVELDPDNKLTKYVSCKIGTAPVSSLGQPGLPSRGEGGASHDRHPLPDTQLTFSFKHGQCACGDWQHPAPPPL